MGAYTCTCRAQVVNASRAANGATAAAQEADLLRRVQHANVVQLLDVRHEALGDVLVLEWCCCDLEQARGAFRDEGLLTAPSLSRRLPAAQALQTTRPRLEPLPEAAIRVLFADLLHALAACHEAGVVHLARHSFIPSLLLAAATDWLAGWRRT